MFSGKKYKKLLLLLFIFVHQSCSSFSFDNCLILFLNHRYWDKENGFFSARNSNICEVDTTCMAIRLLRLHGFDVSPGKSMQNN